MLAIATCSAELTLVLLLDVDEVLDLWCGDVLLDDHVVEEE